MSCHAVSRAAPPQIETPGLAGNVAAAINSSQGYASSSIDTVNRAIMSIQESVAGAWPTLDPYFLDPVDIYSCPENLPDISVDEVDSIEVDSIEVDSFEVDSFEVDEFEVDEFDKEVDEMPDADLINVDIPDFDDGGITIAIPDPPSESIPIFNKTAPSVARAKIPDRPPSDKLPPIPILEEVVIPPAPDYETIEFKGGVVPTDDLTPPTEIFKYTEKNYQSALGTVLEGNLLSDIRTGGTGLKAETEQALWDRATARQNAENEKTYNEALNFHSSRGFDLPSGALNSTLLEVSAKINQTNTDLNNDILVKTSDLAQKNTWFIIEQAIDYEKSIKDFSDKIANRAFESAKTVVEMANAIYMTKVEAFRIRLDAWKANAEIYESEINGQRARAEVYKARIEGAGVVAKVNKTEIEAYTAQIEGLKSQISIYATEMEGAKIESEIGKIDLEIYATRANVFKSEIEGVSAVYNAYQAQVAGESAKASLLSAKAQAYEAQVKGLTANVEVNNKKVDVLIAKQQGVIETFKASVAGHIATAQAQTETGKATAQAQIETGKATAQAQIETGKATAQAKIETGKATAMVQGTKADIVRANAAIYAAQLDGNTKKYMAQIEKVKAQALVSVQENIALLQQQTQIKETGLNAMTATAKVGGQLAAAALTAISTSMSLGQSSSNNTSNNASNSAGNSASCTNSSSASDTYSHGSHSSHIHTYMEK